MTRKKWRLGKGLYINQFNLLNFDIVWSKVVLALRKWMVHSKVHGHLSQSRRSWEKWTVISLKVDGFEPRPFTLKSTDETWISICYRPKRMSNFCKYKKKIPKISENFKISEGSGASRYF